MPPDPTPAAPAAAVPAVEAAAAAPAVADAAAAPAAPAAAPANATPPAPEPTLLEAATGKKPEAKPEAKPESKAADAAKETPAPAEAAKPDAEKPKDDAAKATDPAKAATAETPPAPIKYEAFKVPDGVKLDDKELTKFTDIVGAKHIPQEDAQKLLDLYVEDVKRVAEEAQTNQRNVWNKLNDNWKSDTRKELGNNLETDLAMAKAVIEEFAGTKEQQAEYLAHLSNNGMGNFIGHIRLLRNIGKALNVFEDSSVVANPTAPKMPKGTPGSGKTGWYEGNGASAS